MTLAIKDAKDVEVKRFTVKQPGFWATILIDTENVAMKDIYINATSYNPEVSGLRDVRSRRPDPCSLGRTTRVGCRTPTVWTLTDRTTSPLVSRLVCSVFPRGTLTGQRTLSTKEVTTVSPSSPTRPRSTCETSLAGEEPVSLSAVSHSTRVL
jgi:hypothetical protein